MSQVNLHKALNKFSFNNNYYYITITSRYVHQRYITIRSLTLGGLILTQLFFTFFSAESGRIEKNMLLPHA